MKDVIYRLQRTRNFTVPNRQQDFSIDVWMQYEAEGADLSKLIMEAPADHVVITIDALGALATIRNMYQLSPEKRMNKASSAIMHGPKMILACDQYPFLDPGTDEAEHTGRVLGEFLVDDIDYYLPEEGFRQAAKLHFMKNNGDDPNRTDDGEGRYYRRRRRRYHRYDEDMFHISFVRFNPNRVKSGPHKPLVPKPGPVLKHHLYSLLRRITQDLPGTVKMYDRWDLKDIQRYISQFLADYVRLYGKIAYRSSGAFLVVLEHYLKCRKITRNKLEDDFCNWLDEEAKSRVVKKLLKESKKKYGKDWTTEAPQKYTDVGTHNPVTNPISVAHGKVMKKFYEEQDKKLKAQARKLKRQEAKARKAGITQKEEGAEDTGTIVGQVGETLSAAYDNATAVIKRTRKRTG